MTFPNIPTGFNQLIIVLCLGIIIFSYQNINSRSEKLSQYTDKELFELTDFDKLSSLSVDSVNLITSISFYKAKIAELDSKIFNTNKSIANKHNVDSIKTIYKLMTNSLLNKMDSLQSITDLLFTFRMHQELKHNYMDIERKRIVEDLNRIIISLIPIFILFFTAIISLSKEESVSRKLREIELYKNIYYLRCQSCAKVFSPKLLYGKEKDGTLNKGFCIECYQDGLFTNPEFTSDEVIAAIKHSNPKEKNVEKTVKKMLRWNPNAYK